MMAKRGVDIVVSLLALAVIWPIVAVLALLVWAQDRHSPFYFGWRVGSGGRDFRMIKLRSMVVGADRLGGASTAGSDARLTPIGRFIRRWKLDELPQFWNVLSGEMSLVGPRPNVRAGGVDRYTPAELRLLDLRPGLTDLASIVFSDEAEILDGAPDADALYDALIRPWKSRLGLLYVARRDLGTDLWLIVLTLVAIVSKPTALRAIDAILAKWRADAELRRVCARREPLVPAPQALQPA
jgi:lipopolysaccharide/colanic/teichoic acid biosynthesis glycosyltransferase